MKKTCIFLLLLAAISSQGADRFTLVRSVVAGGGAVNSVSPAFSPGRTIAISGTIGQPEAGLVAGTRYSVLGGVWFRSAPVIFAPQRSGFNISFLWETEPGSSYSVDYTTSLKNPVWQPLISTNGDGSVKTFSEPLGTGMRFYRVREQ